MNAVMPKLRAAAAVYYDCSAAAHNDIHLPNSATATELTRHSVANDKAVSPEHVKPQPSTARLYCWGQDGSGQLAGLCLRCMRFSFAILCRI